MRKSEVIVVVICGKGGISYQYDVLGHTCMSIQRLWGRVLTMAVKVLALRVAVYSNVGI